MADSTPNLDQISSSQAGQDTVINAGLDAVSAGQLYGRHASACVGLTWGYYGGWVPISGVPTSVANGTVTLTASTTNYVRKLDSSGVVSVTTSIPTSWPALNGGYTPLYDVVTGTASVTSWHDYRSSTLFTAGSGAAPSGSAGGDLTGTYPNPTVTTNAISNAKLAQMTAHTYKGNNTGSTANASDVSAANLAADIIGGSTTQLQYNSSSAFAGDSRLTFNSTTKILTGQFAIDSNAVNAQTGTSYSLVASDNGKVITLSNGSAITLSVPENLGSGFSCMLIQIGAGQVTVASSGSPGPTIHSYTSLVKLAGQYAAATLVAYAPDIFELTGSLA